MCVCVCVCVYLGSISSLRHISLNSIDILCIQIFVFILSSVEHLLFILIYCSTYTHTHVYIYIYIYIYIYVCVCVCVCV